MKQKTALLCVLNAKYIHASPAPWCLKAGIKEYAPEIYDCVQIEEATVNTPIENVIDKICAEKPDVVSFSCYLWNIVYTLRLSMLIKERLPETVIVLGGPEVSYCAEKVLAENACVDYIISGEGEKSVPEFLNAVFKGDSVKGISGVCGRNSDGSIFVSEACVLDCDVPSPLEAGYSEAASGRIVYFETSRGCPYSCAFCLSGRCGKARFFNEEKVLADLIKLSQCGSKTIKFVDRTFNANPAHANKILQFIAEHYGKEIPSGVCFQFEIAGDILREDTFLLLEQMPRGIVRLEIGMQSFNEKTLTAVHRKTNTDILEKNIRRLMCMGNIHIHIDLIAGLPHETYEIFAQSFNRGYNMGAHMLQLGFLKILYGSPMHSYRDEFPCEYKKEPPYEVVSTPWITSEELEKIRRAEDALERIYNSGRFLHTAEYVIKSSGLSPFEFYTAVGDMAENANVGVKTTLDEYTAFLKNNLTSFDGVDETHLRDMLVTDRLESNPTGRMPACLRVEDSQLSVIKKKLAQNEATAPLAGVRRGVAILYGEKAVCMVDYLPENQNPVTGRWSLMKFPLTKVYNLFY